ncbi:MAG: Peptidylprolyl isomerase [Bacteroidota bacterium]
MNKKLIGLALISALSTACENQKYEIIDGVKIQVHSHDENAVKLQDGDIVSFDVVIKNHKDSILQDSRDQGRPGRALIRANDVPGQFKGTFDMGLRLLSVGDSATIFVPIDSLMAMSPEPLPEFLKSGTDLQYVVKIISKQTKEEYDAEVKKEQEQAAKDAIARKETQPADIQKFIDQSGKKFNKTASGLRYSIEKQGTGEKPVEGSSYIATYKGMFLDGKVFDQGEKVDMPMGQMIPGFNEALEVIKVGGKGTVVIPSEIGYGEETRGPIPGNSALVFEIEIHSKK